MGEGPHFLPLHKNEAHSEGGSWGQEVPGAIWVDTGTLDMEKFGNFGKSFGTLDMEKFGNTTTYRLNSELQPACKQVIHQWSYIHVDHVVYIHHVSRGCRPFGTGPQRKTKTV